MMGFGYIFTSYLLLLHSFHTIKVQPDLTLFPEKTTHFSVLNNLQAILSAWNVSLSFTIDLRPDTGLYTIE